MNPVNLTLLILTLGHFLVDYMIGVWAVYKTIAGLDVAVAGLIAGLSALAGEGMQLVFGSLSDKGHRKVLITGGLAVTCASAMMAYTQEYTYLFLLFMLTCIGSGAFHPSAGGLIGKLSPHRKNFFLTVFMAGGALGLASSQLIFTSAYEALSGNTVYLAVPTLCLVAFLAFYSLAETNDPYILPGRGVDLKAFFGFFKHTILRRLYFVQLFNQALLWGLIFLLPDLLVYRDYPDWVSLGGGHLCLVMGCAFMIIPGRYLFEKFSSKSIIVYTQVFALTFLLVFLAIPHLSEFPVLGLLFCMGITFGLVQPVVLGMASELVPQRPGMVSAFLMGLVWCIAEGLGQGGGGLLTKLFEENATAKSLAILASFSIFAIMIALRLPFAITEEQKYRFATER